MPRKNLVWPCLHAEPLEVQELHRRSLLAHNPAKSAWAPKTNRASATTFVQVHTGDQRLWFSQTVQEEVQPVVCELQHRHAHRVALITPKCCIGGRPSMAGLPICPSTNVPPGRGTDNIRAFASFNVIAPTGILWVCKDCTVHAASRCLALKQKRRW